MIGRRQQGFRFPDLTLESKTVVKTSSYIYFLSIITGLLIHEHYTREFEFGNFDKIKNKNNTKTRNNTKKKHKKKTQKLLTEFFFK